MERPLPLGEMMNAAGIRVRRTPDSARGWDYALPAIQRDWYGPYPTEADAVVAAVQYLIQRVQLNPAESSAPTPSSVPAAWRNRLAQRDALQERLDHLQIIAAHDGIKTDPAVVIEIEDIRRQLKEIDAQLTGAGDNL